jgi:hypothetical protein
MDEWNLAAGKLLKGGAGNYFKHNTAWIHAQYDQEALYLLVRWQDVTPMCNTSNPEKGQAGRAGGDCLELHILTDRLVHLQGWFSIPLHAGAVRLGYGAEGGEGVKMGRAVPGIAQAFKLAPDGQGYVQELKIAWKVLTTSGQPPKEHSLIRLGCDLWWDGLDPEAGYREWSQISAGTMNEKIDARWGGRMAFGFMDGVNIVERVEAEQNPKEGALGTLLAKGKAPATPPRLVLHEGRQITRNTKIDIVPAPAGVKIDGKLGDWDTSGGILIAYEPVLFKDRYSVRLHMMYDDQGLYAGLLWHDLRPLFNVNRPDRFAWGYDGGGALQLRLLTDMVSTIEAWYSSTAQRPVLKQAVFPRWTYAMDDLETRGARQAFTAGPGGYTQEIFLPWRLITKDGQPRHAGDTLRWVTDTWWSGVEGNRLPFVVNARVLPRTEVVALPGKATRKELVTAVIDDANGVRVRNLFACQPRNVGDALGGWDGLDNEGRVAPPGVYHYKLLTHTGIGWNYRMTFENPGNPPWENDSGAGAWGSETSAPQGVATFGDQVFFSWPSAEKGFGLIGADLAGQKQWGVSHSPADSNAGASTLAADAKYVYYAGDAIAENDDETVLSYVACFDKRTGMRRGFSLFSKVTELTRWKRRMARHAWWWEMARDGFTPEAWGMHREIAADPYKGCGANVTGIAVRDGLLYIAFYQFDKVLVLKADTAKQVREFPVRRPCGLAFDADGRLLVVSEKQVLALDIAGGHTTPVITHGLEAPFGICTDTERAIYVSDWGRAMCVKVFSPDGAPRRTIGTPGGRPTVGRFDQNGMLLPRQIAVDTQQHLWVMEDDGEPRRISEWDARTGALVRDFIGASRSGEAHNATTLDPQDPTRAISHYVEYRLDWEKKTYRPVSTLWRANGSNALPFLPRSGVSGQVRMIHLNGRTFLVNGNPIMIGEYRDGRFRPLAAVGHVWHGNANTFMEANEALYLPFFKWGVHYLPEAFRGKANGTVYAWSDQNGDGRVDPEEVTFARPDTHLVNLGDYWGAGVGNDLSIAASSGASIMRLRPLGWTACGAPIYDPNKAERIIPEAFENSTVAIDGSDRILTSVNEEVHRWRNVTPTLAGYAADGKLRWTYPVTRGEETGVMNGNTLIGPVALPHGMGEMISQGQYHGHRLPLVTTDGLFIASILRDQASAATLGPDVLMDEATQQMVQTADGKVYIINGMTWRSLLEVTGLETIRRAEGTFTLTPAHTARAAALKQARVSIGIGERPKSLTIPRAKTPVQVDGKLDEWDRAAAIAVGPTVGTLRAQAWLAYDATNLYVAYSVVKPRGFVNAGGLWQQLFTTGDCTDLLLGRQLTYRRAPAEGDLRILFSKLEGTPVAIRYRAIAPGSTSPRVSFASGVGVEWFAAVEPLKTARVAIADTATGYALEAAVPWAELGVTATAGMKMLGDLGVVFADAGGRSRAERFCVFNADPFLTDVPTEARLTPDKWGTLIFE